jgi:hypothetical protein
MFGGTTISLILPKLIRSIIRDGIGTFRFGRQLRQADISYSTTQGRRTAFNGRPAKPNCCLLLFVISKSSTRKIAGMGRRPPAGRRPI